MYAKKKKRNLSCIKEREEDVQRKELDTPSFVSLLRLSVSVTFAIFTLMRQSFQQFTRKKKKAT
jgi:hypothetical protein